MENTFPRSLNINRYKKIVSVMARHGFGSFLANLQIDRRISISPQLLKLDPGLDHTPAEHLRLALEELGPTFVKLGQILTTRPDLLGPEYIKELSKLRDAVPPAPWEAVHALLVEELGGEPEQYFEHIEPQPLAAASLGQVHLATLKTGEEVVVKIQRPGIQATMATDLEILKDLASLAQNAHLKELHNPAEVVEEFSYALNNELDYCLEGRNADHFRDNFAGNITVYIPKIYWEYSTSRVLVMDRLQGIKIDDLAALDTAGYDRKQVALNVVNMVIKSVLEDGFFHADPHAGNYLVMPGEVIGLMDFGAVGELTESDRKHLIHLYISVISLDPDGIIDELIRMGATEGSVDRSKLERDVERLLGKYAGRPLKDIHLQVISEELRALSFRHCLYLPTNLWQLAKTLVMIEGLGVQLDPDFDFWAVSDPYVQKMKSQVWLPTAEWAQTIRRHGADWVEFFNLLPRTGRRLLEKADGDSLFDIGLRDKDVLLSGLFRMVNRLSLSIIIAAMVVSLAILVAASTSGSPLQILVSIGFAGTLGLGFWLLISILKGSH